MNINQLTKEYQSVVRLRDTTPVDSPEWHLLNNKALTLAAEVRGKYESYFNKYR